MQSVMFELRPADRYCLSRQDKILDEDNDDDGAHEEWGENILRTTLHAGSGVLRSTSEHLHDCDWSSGWKYWELAMSLPARY